MKKRLNPVSVIILLVCSYGFVLNASLRPVSRKAAPFRQGRDFALFFAVEDYDTSSGLDDLKFPIEDAFKIGKELEIRYGFTVEIVRNPTQEEIIKKLEEYQQKFNSKMSGYDPDGQLFIMFSGHGEKDFNSGYFLPRDANPSKLLSTGLRYSDIRPRIDNIPCKHILVMVDACYSGYFDPNYEVQYRSGKEETPKPSRGRPGEDEITLRQKIMLNHENYVSRLFLTSASDVKVPDKSVFVNNFLKALVRPPQSDEDGILQFLDILPFIDQSNPKPHYGDFGSSEHGGDFHFYEQAVSNLPSLAATKEREKDANAWKLVKDTNTIESYERYIRRFPNGAYVTTAQQRINMAVLEKNDELDWEYCKDYPTMECYANYLQKHPLGKYGMQAETKVKELKEQGNTPFNPSNSPPVNTVRDPYGAAYHTIVYEGKTWLTNNLNIPVNDSWCYNEEETNCDQYGRLYTYQSALSACTRLGVGWRLPTDKEWKALAVIYGGYTDGDQGNRPVGDPNKAFQALADNGLSAFNVSFGGMRLDRGIFGQIDAYGYYWTSTEIDQYFAMSFTFLKNNENIIRRKYNKQVGQYCRCVKD